MDRDGHRSSAHRQSRGRTHRRNGSLRLHNQHGLFLEPAIAGPPHFPASTQHNVAECLGRAALPCSDVAGVLCVLVGEGTLGIRAVHVDAVGKARSDEGF